MVDVPVGRHSQRHCKGLVDRTIRHGAMRLQQVVGKGYKVTVQTLRQLRPRGSRQVSIFGPIFESLLTFLSSKNSDSLVMTWKLKGEGKATRYNFG